MYKNPESINYFSDIKITNCLLVPLISKQIHKVKASLPLLLHPSSRFTPRFPQEAVLPFPTRKAFGKQNRKLCWNTSPSPPPPPPRRENILWRGTELFQCIQDAASTFGNPLTYVWKLLLWFLLRVTWFTTQFVNLPVSFAKVHFDEDAPDPPPPPQFYLDHYPCDQKRTLYMMNYTTADNGITDHPDYCSRPFHARRVSTLHSIPRTLYSVLEDWERLRIGCKMID